MTAGRTPYDAEIQMFVERPCEPNLDRLRFIRWLVEHGRLEHEAAGASCGEYAALAEGCEPAAA